MHEQFIVLSIIIAIIIILLSPDLVTGLIIVALIANIITIYKDFTEEMTDATDNNVTETVPTVDESTLVTIDNTSNVDNYYGNSQAEYDAYNYTYSTAYEKQYPIAMRSCSEKDQSVDNNIVQAQRARSRDKRTMDGITLKDANYYKHHYANELDESEKKLWWGNDEY